MGRRGGAMTDQAPAAFKYGGEFVMAAARVAAYFDVETRIVNQNASRKKIKRTHGFQLPTKDFNKLKSQGVIYSEGRGRPSRWVFTPRGVIWLSTVIRSPRAEAALDTVIDTFIETAEQVGAGRNQVTLSEPDRLRHGGLGEQFRDLGQRLSRVVDDLLDQPMIAVPDRTVRDELQEKAGALLNNVNARLNQKSLENDKLAAEALLLAEQTLKLRDERLRAARREKLELESLELDNLNKRITAVERVATLCLQLGSDAAVEAMGAFGDAGHRYEGLVERIERISENQTALPPPDDNSSSR